MAETSPSSRPRTEAKETRLLVEHGFTLARALGIERVLVIAELITDRRLVGKHRKGEKLLWVTRDQRSLDQKPTKGDHCVELSALDGGFVIDRKGVVERAGVYLDAPVTRKVEVAKGLGSRHVAAAATTAKANCLAIVISESSGTTTVFSDGSEVMSLNRPPRA